jgi:hypothetical protein
MSVTATYQLGVGGDDGWWGSAGSFTPAGTLIEMGEEVSDARLEHVWLRYPNTMPTGIIIEAARLDFTCVYTYAVAPCNLRVYFNAADAAVAPVSAETADGKALTTNFVAWTPGGWTEESVYSSPDLSVPLQEVIDRPGRLANGAVMALIKAQKSSANLARRFFYGREGNVSKAVKLVVTYREGGLAVVRTRALLGVGI